MAIRYVCDRGHGMVLPKEPAQQMTCAYHMSTTHFPKCGEVHACGLPLTSAATAARRQLERWYEAIAIEQYQSDDVDVLGNEMNAAISGVDVVEEGAWVLARVWIYAPDREENEGMWELHEEAVRGQQETPTPQEV